QSGAAQLEVAGSSLPLPEVGLALKRCQVRFAPSRIVAANGLDQPIMRQFKPDYSAASLFPYDTALVQQGDRLSVRHLALQRLCFEYLVAKPLGCDQLMLNPIPHLPFPAF